MKLYSQLEVASLENLASDPTLLPEGRIWFNTTSGLVKIRIGGATKVLMRDDLAQVATYANVAALPAAGNAGRIAYLSDSKKLFFDNGTAWGPVVGIVGLSATASSNIKLHRSGTAKMQLVPGDNATADGSVSSSLAELDPKIANYADVASLPTAGVSGRLAFVTADGQLYKDNGTSWGIASGSGSGGGINYILNPGAEVDTSGWVTYADAAGVAPVNGIDGSPNTTWIRSTSSPLRTNASFQLVKTASASRQGEGASYAFAIDSADQGKVLQGSFDYKVVSGTFADDAVRIYIYDVTNATVQQVAPYLLKNVSTPSEKFGFEFQTAVNSTSYRFIIHIAGTDTVAYTLGFDNFAIGPTAKLYGSPVTDWQSFTGSGGWTTNTTYVSQWRRVGDSLEVNQRITTSGAPNSATLTINLPPGLVIDQTKLLNFQGTNSPIGRAGIWDNSGPAVSYAAVRFFTTTAVALSNEGADQTFLRAPSSVDQVTPITFAASDEIWLSYRVPIVGWGSTALMSQDASTRVVAARFIKSSTSSAISGSFTTEVWQSLTYDTHGAASTGTGLFTAPVSGYYQSTGHLNVDSGSGESGFAIQYVKNGVGGEVLVRAGKSASTAGFNYAGVFNTTIFLNAGDTFGIQRAQAAGTVNITSGLWHIQRVSGPSQIAASESVNAAYSTAAGQAVPNTTDTIVNFGTKDFDSHNAVTTGASWKFTAPIAGVYQVSVICTLGFTASSAVTGESIANLFKNGATVSGLGIRNHDVANNSMAAMQGAQLVKMNAGDYIDIRIYQNNGASKNLEANATKNRISITRVGN